MNSEVTTCEEVKWRPEFWVDHLQQVHMDWFWDDGEMMEPFVVCIEDEFDD